MKTSYIVALLALSASVLALPGCAADTDEGTDPNEIAKTTDVRVGVDTDQVGTTYAPRVTMKDIKDGFGSCVGTTCTINGRVWDCKGGGYCSLAL